MLPFRAFQHFVLSGVPVACEMADVGHIHHARDIITDVTQKFFQHILHDIGSEVADMGKMIHGGTAGIHLHLAGFVRDKFLYRF